ncbi:hypothetical protein ACHAXT_007427 [Thalassiosira profunda]
MKHAIALLALQASGGLAFTSQAPPRTSPLGRPLPRGGDHNHKAWALASSADDDGDNNPLNLLSGLFSPPSNASVAQPEPKIPDVVVDADYTLAAAFAAVGVSIVALNQGVAAIVGGGFVTLLASLFAVQATRLRFVFDNDSFELKAVEAVNSDDLTDSGENIIVGGANRWRYDTFVNYDFFPSLAFPILVYFKETQTTEDGQIHFFPAIANVKQLDEQFELRGCASIRE